MNKAFNNNIYFPSFAVKEKFSLPQDLVITVTDETGTEVDEDVFPDLMSTSGLLLVINALNDSGE